MKKTLIVLLGPTGIGKSDLSIRLAQAFQTEIISADSRQIYRELSIGTAVPSAEDRQKVPHHLIHSHSLTDYYSVSNFEQDTLAILDQLFLQKDLVVMTGGSMLYIDAVCNGIDHLPDPDPQLRKSLNLELEIQGLEHLRLRLKKLDPAYYSVVDLKNPKRLLRAVEVCLITGKPFSSFLTGTKKERPFRILKIGLNTERETLYDRINRRVDRMMEAGLEAEARSMYPLRGLNSLNTVGYKELFNYFDGKTDLQTAVELIKQNTRHYARRQLTWFRQNDQITWFKPEQEQEILKWIEDQ